MQKVFEKIIEKLEEYKKITGINTIGSYCQTTLSKAIEIVKQAAEEYNESLMKELLEAKKNCGEDSDCSGCIFGQVNDRCYLQELQIGNSNGWIPCSERLPEEIGWYLVSRNDGIVTTGYFFEDMSWREARGVENIAWQPLPDPYQPKGEPVK